MKSLHDPFSGELLGEGLIYSLNADEVVRLLNKSFKKLFNKVDKDDTHINILIKVNDLDYLSLSSSRYISGIHPAPNISDLIEIMNNFGWYPSYVRTGYDKNVTEKYYSYSNKKIRDSILNDEISYIMLTFEAKYDTKADIDSKYLYHVTDAKYLDKILSKGLIPKSKSKLSSHPDRIYAVSDMNQLKHLLKHPGQSIGSPKYIQIDLDKIPNVVWYIDPNFEYGVYTYSNIPPNAISIINTL